MALYSFRDVRRLWGVHMHSLWTRKDTWDLSPPSVENHPVTPSPPAPELKFTVKNRPCIRPCSHAVPTNPWPQPGVGVGGGRGRKPHSSHIPSHLRSTWPGGPVGGFGHSNTLSALWHPPGDTHLHSKKEGRHLRYSTEDENLCGAPPGILSFYLLINRFKTFSLLSPGLFLPFQSSD